MYPDVYVKIQPTFDRIYPFGSVPTGTTTPYATHQLVGGGADANLSCAPDSDDYSIQIDVWDKTSGGVLSAAKTIRDALEPKYTLGYRSTARDPETKLFRYIMRFDVLEVR